MADLTPTREMAAEAAKGLRWYAAGRGGAGIVPATLSWARRIAARDQLSPDRVVKMRAWHARHAVDLEAPQNADPRAEGYPGPGRVASALWGGPAAAAWAERKIEEMEREAEEDARRQNTSDKETDKMERRELSGPGWTPRQSALYDVIEQVAEVFGPFDTGTGPDGIHYIEAADNPFAAEGIRCANCAFYEGGGGCGIVSDEVRVDPDAACKFWLIPGDRLAQPEQPSDDPAADDEAAAPEMSAADLDHLREQVRLSPEEVEFAELRARMAGEARTLSADVTEVRAMPEDDGGYTIEGHAAVFDSNSYPLPDGRGGTFVEQVKRGAFRRALQNPEGPVSALVNHDPNLMLASTAGNPPSLELWEDPKGLRFRARVAPTSYAEDLRLLMERGDVAGMSFGFTVEADRWWQDGEGRTRRDIQRIGRLTDVSVVTASPAYPEPASEITSREADVPHEEATASEPATGGPSAAASASTRRRRIELLDRTAPNPIRKDA